MKENWDRIKTMETMESHTAGKDMVLAWISSSCGLSVTRSTRLESQQRQGKGGQKNNDDAEKDDWVSNHQKPKDKKTAAVPSDEIKDGPGRVGFVSLLRKWSWWKKGEVEEEAISRKCCGVTAVACRARFFWAGVLGEGDRVCG